MAEREPLRRKNLPDVVAEEVRAKISEGEYTGRLPAVNQLAEDHGVSRPTILSALKLLATEGEIVVRQGAGTFVKGTQPIRQRSLEAGFRRRGITQEDFLREPISDDPMSFSDIYHGLRIYEWTKQRFCEIDYSESPSQENFQSLEEAAGRVIVLDKIAEGITDEPKNSLLRVGLINTFKTDIQTIQRHGTLGNALGALAEARRNTNS